MMARAALLESPRTKQYVAHQTFDPIPVLKTLDIPFLAVFGADDPVVPVERSPAAMRRAFARAGNERFHTPVFPRADHGIRASVRGREWGAFAPGYPDRVVDWVLQEVGGHEKDH